MSANFTPVFGGYREPGAFKFWCQKVLPLVYDDSLSYYELLCKVVDYINNLIHDNSQTIDNMDALLTAYNQLQDYVNTYFANLDLTGEVSNKIDEMVDNGELLAVIQPALDTFEQYLVNQSAAQQTYNEQTRTTVNTAIAEQTVYNTESREILTEGILAQDQYNRETRTQTGTAINQQNTYNQQTREMVSAMVGHPFTASTSAQMTDTTKIYVYTGTTTSSFTNGHWYYYNGSVWADGGVYNSAAVEINSSLRYPGDAADAGAVGVRLGYFAPPLEWTNGYRINHTTGAAETYTTIERAITDFVNCTTFEDIIGFNYTYTQMGGGVCEVNIYEADGTYLGFIVAYAQGGYFAPGSSTGAPLSTCPDFQKVRFDINLSTFQSEFTVRTIPFYYTDIYTVRRIGTDKYLKDMGVPADAEAVGVEITQLKEDNDELKNQISRDETYIIGKVNYLINATWTDNYSINASGVITADNSYRYSSLIPVESGITYIFRWAASGVATNIRIHGYDANGTWIEQVTAFSSTTSGSVVALDQISTNIKNLRISINKANKATELYYGDSIQDQINNQTSNMNLLDVKLSNINNLVASGEIPYINASTKNASTTNYLAVVVPASAFRSVGRNDIAWDCYCEDEVTPYYMVYDVDLTQSGNSRLTTRLLGSAYTTTKVKNWYKYSGNVGNISPAGAYVAFVFNVIPTDNVKREIMALFRNIIVNNVLMDVNINQVFLYSASPTAYDTVGLVDAGIIGITNKAIGTGDILCIGDSLTAGTYASDQQVHEQNYPYYMHRIVANKVINRGQPGYSASMYWNNNILQSVDFTNVKHIIIMLGTNGGLTDTLDTDVFPYDDYADYATTKTGCYCKIIEYCMEQAPDAQIYLCTTPYFNKDIVPQFAPPTTPNANAVIPKIAEYYHFPMIDVRNGMGINDKNTLTFQSDGLHGNAKFYEKMGTFIGSQFRAKASYIE